jgi:hypothetical protein
LQRHTLKERTFRWEKGEGEKPPPSPLRKEGSQAAAGWYTLDGRKLESKPTKKGLYIVNGNKVVIK